MRTVVSRKLSDIRTLAVLYIAYIIYFIIIWYNNLQGRLWTINKKKLRRNSVFKLRMKFLVGVSLPWRGVAFNVTQSLFDPPLTGLRRRVVGRRSRRVA